MNENVFASGQTYVALSRVKHLEDLFLLAFEQGAIYLDERQRELLKWMDSVDICVDGAFPRSSWPPIMPTLPEQSFITKKQHVKKESGSTEQLLIEIKGRQEIKAKQEKIWLVFVVPTLLVQVLESADKIMWQKSSVLWKVMLVSPICTLWYPTCSCWSRLYSQGRGTTFLNISTSISIQCCLPGMG